MESKETDKILEAFIGLSGPDKVGKGYIHDKWKVIFMVLLFLPYLLLKFESHILNWFLFGYGCLVILFAIIFNWVFKEILMYEVNPFDFVYLQFSLFILAIIQFGFLYYILFLSDPLNFHSLILSLNSLDFVYFSFVNISTLGYGDLVPITKPGRVLVVMQLIYGMWFLVTVIPVAVSLQSERMAHHALKRKELANEIKKGLINGSLKVDEVFETKKGVGIVKSTKDNNKEK